MKMDRIVVAVDGSANSIAAVGWAADLAAVSGAEVVAVHALGLLEGADAEGPVPTQSHREEIRIRFESSWCSPLAETHVPCRHLLRDGNPVSVILAVADEEAADLIVVGSRGLGGYPELLLGSTSTQIAQRSPRPVVIVPTDPASVSESSGGQAIEPVSGSSRLSLLLAMAMFVLVVDTSIMNVSITAVVWDLDTSVSSIQAAIALEALVSAAFILISSKVGDLIGRKLAYTLGLLAYAIGALAMTLTQSVTTIIIFWAIIGGLGASLLLPAMQSLIHGNFEGAAQKKTYALVGASAAVGAAIGPLLGGFVTTYLSWRVGFLLEVVIIAIVLANLKLVIDVEYTGERKIDLVGAGLSVVGMGGVVLGILVWQEGGEYVLLLMALGAVALALLARWLVRRRRAGEVTLLDPNLFKLPNFRVGASQMVLQQITLGGAMIALPLYLQVTLEYNAMQAGLSLAPLSLTMFAVALLAGKKAGDRRPAAIIRAGFGLALVGMALVIPVIPVGESGWALLIPLVIAGAGLGLLVSQLNNYILAPIEEERISEAAGVNSAGQSFGLSFGLAMAGGLLLAALSLSFVTKTEASDVIPPAEQEQIADALEDNAQLVSTTQLEELLANQPDDIHDEILRINTEAGDVALQVAMLIPVLACLLGFLNSFRLMRLPDIEPSAAIDGLVGG